jgi:hypothetical protein
LELFSVKVKVLEGGFGLWLGDNIAILFMVKQAHLLFLTKYWLVQLATGAKRKVVELFKSCSVGMNGLSTKEDLSIFPLVSYGCLIGIDWLDQHHAILDYRNKEFTCLDEEGNHKKFEGIPMAVTVKEISAMQLKKCFRKGC